MKVKEFIISDVRCFEGEQKFNIRPITFLMGENSTGKSTVLGCFQALTDILRDDGFRTPIDFNSAPYEMGVFADIARKRVNQVKEFILGVCNEYEDKQSFRQVLTLSQNECGVAPAIRRSEWQFSDGKITFELVKFPKGRYITLGRNENEFIVTGDLQRGEGIELSYTTGLLARLHAYEKTNTVLERLVKFLKSKNTFPKEGKVSFYNVTKRFWVYNVFDTHSIAPVRANPQRTYNPTGIIKTPYGNEIPMVLMNLQWTEPKTWNGLKGKLIEFGESSELFSSIHVKTFSKSRNAPFQLQVKTNGSKSNLIDVGYGVSQVLPILVNTIMGERTKFLMQLPEAHLHPKAQAALASLLVTSVEDNKNSFIVETHSDYMIDRVRMEIRKGRIDPENVSLIYLEAINNKVAVHNIEFDKQANLLGAPSGYRNFFQTEIDRLFDL